MNKRKIVIGVSVLVLLLAVVGIVFFLRHQEEAARSQAINAKTTPQFKTLLPQGKSIASLGGWGLVSPPESAPAYAYGDKLDSISIIVSQQQLPSTLSSDDKIASLAKNYNATKKIDVNGLTIYIGTSEQGAQSVIFTKKNLLVLIKSQGTIKDSSWTQYAKQLD